MAAWVTDVPNFLDKRTIPRQFRFLIAMEGALGVGGNLNRWSNADIEAAAHLKAFYTSIRTSVEHGKPYRLERPGQSESSQVQYVAENGSQSVLFASPRTQHDGIEQPLIRARGLDPWAEHRIEPLNREKYQGVLTIPGAVDVPVQLMGQGLKLKL